MTDKQKNFLLSIIKELEFQITAPTDPEKDVLAFTRADALMARDYIKSIIESGNDKEVSIIIGARGAPWRWRGLKEVVNYIIKPPSI